MSDASSFAHDGASASCSERSRQLHEELAGTAPAGLEWALLLEHPRPYAKKSIDSLPAALSARVEGLIEGSGAARLQLIHQPGVELQTPRVFVASTSLRGSRLASVPYAALLRPDVTSLAELMDLGEPLAGPVYLVCVHGRRDACCAKRGVAFERALALRVPGRVFQSSHVGGHRFAATAVVYPQAIYYGRLEQAEAEPLARAHEAGKIGPTQRLRGRASRGAEAQAAEVFALRRHGSVAPAEVHLTREASGEFTFDASGARARLRLERRSLAQASPKGCGEEPARLSAFVETS
ncbi:MAG: hypothetical protein GXP55_21780 [Deltaproteobacteria bacterium]|nr:hypothetical protein [Deltaproteobacteria bacterium]